MFKTVNCTDHYQHAFISSLSQGPELHSIKAPRRHVLILNPIYVLISSYVIYPRQDSFISILMSR